MPNIVEIPNNQKHKAVPNKLRTTGKQNITIKVNTADISIVNPAAIILDSGEKISVTITMRTGPNPDPYPIIKVI